MVDILNKKFSFVYYQDKFFYYFWKSAGLASTWWKSVSFLDLMLDEGYNKEIRNILESQKWFFWEEKEFWLLNRLDWPTTGLLYFAKNLKIYNKFRELQKEWKVNKFYIAEVYWNIQERIDKNGTIISYQIMHHKFSDDRMIVICESWDEKKWRWKIHNVETEICDSQYDEKENRSIVVIKIHKWIRHQIRAHLSTIWYPICWDNIYCKSRKLDFDKLQLYSVWMEIDDGYLC